MCSSKRYKPRRLICAFLLLLVLAALNVLLATTSRADGLSSRMVEVPHHEIVDGVVLPVAKAVNVRDRNITTAEDECIAEHNRSTRKRVAGLTADDLERSRAYLGNRNRLVTFVDKLQQREPVQVAVCGGSISLGHGIHPMNLRYSDQLEVWLNEMYPPSSKHHRVQNMGSHGADMCAMAKRINLLDFPSPTDMFVLEFGINDYQGQDHKEQLDFKTDVFFEGFRELALCAETVVYHLLTKYPNAAVMFLEFQTAILNRKTAQLLHMGVAQHYQIPVISFADAMFPEYLRLVDKLRQFNYSVPNTIDINAIQPFPHGCAPCQVEQMHEMFHQAGCMSLCTFMQRSGLNSNECDVSGRPCYVPFFAHDDVHPSAIGHQIARDLLAEAIASTAVAKCKGKVFGKDLLPSHSGWMVAGSSYHEELRRRSNFLMVNDTMEMFSIHNPLVSNNHTAGFDLQKDQFGRTGWIATNPAGGESITFKIDLPVGDCYAVFVSVLKSYENVGTFMVAIEDITTKTLIQSKTIDCLWKPRISVPNDIQVSADDVDSPSCTGKCLVTITTNARTKETGMNQVKILSLSARTCISKA